MIPPRALLLFASWPLLMPAAFGATGAPSSPPSGQGDPLDSARTEMEIGRFWHAARILADLRASGVDDPMVLLLSARAAAGHGDWPTVRELLGDATWVDSLGGSDAWALLGRAYEEGEQWAEAARAYQLAVDRGRMDQGDGDPGEDDPELDPDALRFRTARALERAGDPDQALALLEDMETAHPALRSWGAHELGLRRSESGDTVTFERLLALVTLPDVRRLTLERRPEARLAAADSVGAEAAYRMLVDSLGTMGAPPSGIGRAWLGVARLRLARADTGAAVASYRASFESGGLPEAARALLELDSLSREVAREAASVLSAARFDGPALQAFDLHASTLPEGLTLEDRVDRARVLARLPSRQADALTEFRALREELMDPDLRLRNLEAWIDFRRRQGRSAEVATLQRWLIEEHPESAAAVELVFLRGDAAQDRGALDQALGHYARLQEMNPALDRSGLARMRASQIHLGRGEPESALEIFLAYLAGFPEGRRWQEASYWGASTLLELGREDEGRALLADLLERDPVSYYSVQASALLGQPYQPAASAPGPAGAGELPQLPDSLQMALQEMDLLLRAGLLDGATAQLDALVTGADAVSPQDQLGVARELIERGFTIEGINIGWAVRARGEPWSRTLMEVVYPFPHRAMIGRTAAERGIEPTVVAALIRQESAFDVDIVSSAGAVGLMQVLPSTGRELARAERMTLSSTGLMSADVNLQLGTRFFRDMWSRYDGELPLVLSAYNAGPTRANRWRRFPEAADPLRFTERIPFSETRDYVKQVTRNIAIYGFLYGSHPASDP